MSQKGISGTRRPGLNNEAIHGILGATGDQRHWNAFSDRVPWYHIKKNKKLKKKSLCLEVHGSNTFTFCGLSESPTSIILCIHFE